MAEDRPRFSVSDFVTVLNQTLDGVYPTVEVEGEVAGFKVNQGKYVFFDLKDEESSVGCFMMLWQLRQPIEDGMKIVVRANPRLTKWGKFSLTVTALKPVGEGDLKKSFEILKAKLATEGLFAVERKRTLPRMPQKVGVISSTQAAGFADFIKIVNDRWGGLVVSVAHVQVQGEAAPDQIIQAIEYFNTLEDLPEALVIIRGGGSQDDLAAFNDEPLVRAIAASRIPTLVGVGHETDESLADLVADVRAATPSNAAQILVPDKREIITETEHKVESILIKISQVVDNKLTEIDRIKSDIAYRLDLAVDRKIEALRSVRAKLAELDPGKVLTRGYAILRSQPIVGKLIEIETEKDIIEAEVRNVRQK